MVVSHKELMQAISDGKIKLRKSSPSGNTFEEKDYDIAEIENHKIQLHVGFLIKTLSSGKYIAPETLYDNRDGIVDMQKLPDNSYSIDPGETVIMYTNETVTLDSNYFGLLLPKVSYEGKGLFISTSYVDPNWTGVLQLLVSNRSPEAHPIKKDTAIANLVILKTSEAIREEPSGTGQSDHYKLTWKKISEDQDLLKWTNRKRSVLTKIRHTTKKFRALQILAILGTIGGVFVGISAVIQTVRLFMEFIG